MIKAVILGAETAVAGELFRILVYHPDVEITAAVSSGLEGQPVSDRHAGLIGDTDLCFVSAPDYDKCNVVFVCGDPANMLMLPDTIADDMRVIDMTGAPHRGDDYVPGICEVYRKAMVRGARKVYTVSPGDQAAAIALMPLAKLGMLEGEIEVIGLRDDSDVVTEAVKAEYPGFQGHIAGGIDDSADSDGMCAVSATVKVPTGADQLRRIYKESFADHNFVFVVDQSKSVTIDDLANTNKCLVRILPDGAIDNGVRVEVSMDHNIKGGAGNAVHCMNLLFGLHERTGLNLKAYANWGDKN